MGLPSILTARILLRPVEHGDVDALHALWTSPEVRYYLWDDVVIPRATAEQAVAAHLSLGADRGIGYWALSIPPTPPPTEAPLAGFCGFRLIDAGPDLELMYALRKEHWGKGLAAEACTAALEYLWRETSYPRIYARTDPPNRKSVHVMRRLGMNLELSTESVITYSLDRPGDGPRAR